MLINNSIEKINSTKKFKTRFISIALVVSCMLSAGTVVSAYDAQNQPAVYSGDNTSKAVSIYDTVTADFQNAEETRNNVTSGTPNIVSDPAGGSNKALLIEKTDDTNQVSETISHKKILYKVPENKKGILKYEFDIKFPTDNPMENEQNRWYYPLIMTFSNKNNSPYMGYLRPVNVLPQSSNPNDAVSVDGTGKWYKVAVEFDYSSMTYSLSAAGKTVSSNISFKDAMDKGYDPIDGLSFLGYVPKGFKWYIDNFKAEYTEEQHYSVYSKFYEEDFENGGYDSSILEFPTNAKIVDNSTDSNVPAERGKVIKSDYSAAGTGANTYFNFKNQTTQLNRKKGVLIYEFDMYCTSEYNFYAEKNGNFQFLRNRPYRNQWTKCIIAVDYKNKVAVTDVGGVKGYMDITEEYNNDDLWRLYFRQWESMYYIDNIKIGYFEYAYENVTDVSLKLNTAEQSMTATADFTAYDEDWILLGIYESDNGNPDGEKRLIALTAEYAENLNGSISCSISDFETEYGKAYSAKAMIFGMPGIIPLCNAKSAEYVPPDLRYNIKTRLDDKEYSYPVLMSDEEPMISVNNLARVIGGTANIKTNTVTKGDVVLTYTDGERLAIYNDGHLMLERAAEEVDGELYVPVSSVVPTLQYHMEYRRFNDPPVIEISTGTNYPTISKVIYAEDFGAVGDGVTDDKDAIVKAVNAAVMTGKPTRLEFKKNAVYRLSERMDRNAYIAISDAENLEIEGNGCTFLIEKPTTMFLDLDGCTNVKIKNIKATYEEHTSTQGRITEVDKANRKFTVKLDEGFPDIAPKWWRDSIGFTSFYFGQLYHPTEDRVKITEFDTVPMDDITKIGDRLYQASIPTYRNINCYEVGDRLVIPTRGSGYDTPVSRQHLACIDLRSCKDMLFEGITITGSAQLGISVGLCTGRIKFKNYSMETKEGALLSANSDGLHYWRNRAGLIVEDSKFMANLDDHINTKGEDTKLISKTDSRTIVTEESYMYEVGDEIVLYDTASKYIVGRAFLKEYKKENGNAVLTLDRDLDLSLLRDTSNDKSSNPTRVYDLNVTGEGTIIKNTQFISSRRHAYIGRSQNSIFEGNYVENCGGSGLAAMNEVTDDACEGLFPSAFTFRNNTISGNDGNTSGFYPVEVNSFKSDMNSQKAIDGFLIEGNTVNVPNKD